MVDDFQEKAGEVAEAASSYTQAVLWAIFFCAALALARYRLPADG